MVEMKASPEMALQFIDDSITYWRNALREGITMDSIKEASNYVDAFQAVRVALFGEQKPLEKWQR